MATSATEATGLSELFGRGGIQILVTDFDLENGKHGGDVAEEVKSLNPEVKIICATARTDEALKEAEAASPVADQTVSIHQADFEERFRDFFALAA
jgi:DNA-binding NtrC family response regulator